MKQQKLGVFESRKSKAFSRKAQLQIMENTFVLIIIFFILILALVFTIAVQKSNQRNNQIELQELELIKKSRVLNFLPEMQCSDNNDLDPDCYDILKIETMQTIFNQDKDYYPELIGHVRIIIKQFDPSPEVNQWTNEWLVYDNPKAEDKGYREVQFPVLLRDVTSNSDYFGVIYLGVYE